MEKNLLLENERIITQSDQNIITLTNLRIRYSAKRMGKAHIVSMMLNKVGSIELKYQNNLLTVLIALAGFLTALYGFIENDTNILLTGLIVAGISVYVYIKNRKHLISITSENGKEILFHTKGLRHEDILKFINQVEGAIHDKIK
jgi:hypothetical protein